MGQKLCCPGDQQPRNYFDERFQEIPLKTQSIPNSKAAQQLPPPSIPLRKSEEQILPLNIPSLSHEIMKLAQERNINLEGKEDDALVRCKQGIYHGTINQDKVPHGEGRLYHNDDLLVACFHKGEVQGKALYILKEGSYYEGPIINDRAWAEEASFHSEDLTYVGGFKENYFHGKGKETGKTHEFEGQYHFGNKTQGKLKWWSSRKKKEYSLYTGEFDQKGLFTGQGTLQNVVKGTYEGPFKAGMKHGKGVYKFRSGLRYEGEYCQGNKQGEGTLYDCDENVCYSGQWKNNLPHGKGSTKLNPQESEIGDWSEGVDVSRLIN